MRRVDTDMRCDGKVDCPRRFRCAACLGLRAQVKAAAKEYYASAAWRAHVGATPKEEP